MEAILRMYQVPIGMEMFSAGNEEQWTVISKTIQDSDYYLLIIGHRYGSMTTDGISYTEKEFDYAKSIGVPVFAFLRRDDVATLPKERDAQLEKQEKLKTFREKVSANAIVEFWTNEADLAQNVAIALFKMMQGTPRPGWIRADKALSPEVGKELATLSKENRELKQELDEYKAKDAVKLPNFKLYANNKDSLVIDFKDFGRKYLLGYIEPLRDDTGDATLVDLSGDTPKEVKLPSYGKKIKEYNAKIAENKEAVDQYNAAFEKQNRIANNNVEVIFNIENIGARKANELYVEITFPEEILLFEELPEKEKILRPKNIPSHPYEIPNLGIPNAAFFRTEFPQFDMSKIPSVKTLVNPSNFQINGNQISIKIGTLLHTRQKCISDPVYLIPLRPGLFNAKVTFMCEELPAPIETTLSINVTNDEVEEPNEN